MEPWEPGETGIATWVVEHNEPVMIEDYIIARAAQRMKQVRSEPTYGEHYFVALQRQLEKKGVGDWRQ